MRSLGGVGDSSVLLPLSRAARGTTRRCLHGDPASVLQLECDVREDISETLCLMSQRAGFIQGEGMRVTDAHIYLCVSPSLTVKALLLSYMPTPPRLPTRNLQTGGTLPT